MPTLPSTQDFINRFVGSVPDKGMPDSPNQTNAQLFGVRASGAQGPGGAVGPSNSYQPSLGRPATPDEAARLVLGNNPPANNPIADSGVRRYPGTQIPGSEYDKSARDYYNNLPKTVDEGAIRARAMSAIQGQINAIDNVYASMLANQKITNENNAGRTRATSARSGLLGSDFGNTNAAKTDTLGTDALNTIEAQKSGAIQTLMGNANTRADDQIEKEKNQSMKNSEAWLGYLKGNADSAKTDIANYAKAGVKYNDLTDTEYKTLLDQSGLDPEKFKALFVLNQPVASIATSSTTRGPNGNSIYHVVTRDAQGNFKTDNIDLGFAVPVDWKETNMGNGSIIFYNPSNPTENHIYSASASGNKPTSYEANQKSDALTWMRTQPGYSSSDEAKFNSDPVFQAWVISQGAAAKKAKSGSSTTGTNPY